MMAHCSLSVSLSLSLPLKCAYPSPVQPLNQFTVSARKTPRLLDPPTTIRIFKKFPPKYETIHERDAFDRSLLPLSSARRARASPLFSLW